MTFLIQSGRNSHQNHNVSTKLGLSKVQQATSQNLMQIQCATFCTLHIVQVRHSKATINKK